MNGRPAAEGEQAGSSSGASNLTARNKYRVAPSDGMVDVHVPFSIKRRKHISNERQRRVHMNTLLESLQELLPDPNPRKDRCSLLTDVVDYLRSLEEKTQELTTRKESILNSLAQARTNVNKTPMSATLAMPFGSVCLESLHVQVFKPRKDDDTQLEETIITFTSLRKKGIFSQILLLFSMNKIKIVNATFTTTPDDKMLHFIHAQVPKDLNLKVDDLKALFCCN